MMIYEVLLNTGQKFTFESDKFDAHAYVEFTNEPNVFNVEIAGGVFQKGTVLNIIPLGTKPKEIA